MESAYEKILSLRGMDDFKTLARRLKTMSDNRRKLKLNSIRLPHFLFAEDGGSGVTTHLHLFARLLDELGLFDFRGEEKVIEQVFNDSLDPLLQAVSESSGFNRSFRGIVGVEIEENDIRSDSFSKLIEFAEDEQGADIIFVFIAKMKNGKVPEELVRLLSLSFSLEVLLFPKLSQGDLTYYLVKFVERRGFHMTNKAIKYITEIMPTFEALEGFDGLQSLDNMADAIVYHICTTQNLSKPVFDENSLKNLFENEGYLAQFVVHHSRNKKIGF